VKKYFSKIFTRNTCFALLVGFSFFGIFKYVEYRLNFISETIDKINNEIAVSQNKLNQMNQFDEVANAVGALSKLSKTDPELLKKYSKVYFLNEHYVPISLSKIEPIFLSNKSVNYEIHSNVLPYLEDLIEASERDKVSLFVLSAYRSFDIQTTLKENYKITYGSGANKFSADQGYSEHQLGTAIDFTTGKLDDALEGFDKTPEYQWLLDNAYKYGFVLSYPAGNTYYKFEPWHWRFVGVALATKLYDDKINFYNMDQRLIDNYLANIFD